MVRTLQLFLVTAMLGVPGCRDSLGCLLEQSGSVPIREISANEAAAWLEEEGVTIVHPLPRHPVVPQLENAVWLAPDDPFPDAWLNPEHPIVVVGEPDAAMALAARLARAGAGSLAVVTGELDPLAELRTARQR